VTQRGNRGVDVFGNNEDRLHYINLLREHSESNHVLVWVYTLMTNHIHTIVVPQSETSLFKAFRNTHAAYGQWFNKKYDVKGHLWHARYYSCVLDEAHLWNAVRYVERNPVRAGMVHRAEDYRWSSARSHVLGLPDPLLDPGLPLIGQIGDWADWLAIEDAARDLAAIRKATARDQPFADDAFIEKLEEMLGRPVRSRKRGRKAKSKENRQIQPNLSFSDAD
jgi:putative transposase